MPAYSTIADFSKMLAFLKKEEQLYRRVLHHMEQELMRLQIEDLELRAAIRQEQMKVDSLNDVDDLSHLPSISSVKSPLSDTSKSDPQVSFTDTVREISELSESNSNSQSSKANILSSNITDDRYLDPLVLNTNIDNEDQFIEFDDN